MEYSALKEKITLRLIIKINRKDLLEVPASWRGGGGGRQSLTSGIRFSQKNSHSYFKAQYFKRKWIRSSEPLLHKGQARVTWCDLSPQFFCNDATLLCKFEIDKIRINEFEYSHSQ